MVLRFFVPRKVISKKKSPSCWGIAQKALDVLRIAAAEARRWNFLIFRRKFGTFDGKFGGNFAGYFQHRVWLDEEVTGRNEVTTTIFYVWPLWYACSFSGCEWAHCHGALLCEFSIPECGGFLGGNDQDRVEKQNVVLTWFRPVTWSSGHLGRRYFLTHRIKAQTFRGKFRDIFRKKIRSSKKNLSCKIHSADVPP